MHLLIKTSTVRFHPFISMGYLAEAHGCNYYSVHGLNLSVPEAARSVIKPWDEREDDEKYADSGVDDQVSSVKYLCD